MLSVVDLQVRYGGVEAVRGVSFAAAVGLTSLVGRNGAGKTSILHAIAGLVSASGAIRLGDVELDPLEAEERARVGLAYIPDGRRLFPTLSVEQNVVVGSIGISDRAGAKAAVEETFARFPLLDARRRQLASTLSGGEGQLLLIARALVAKPRVLLVDEPTQGLSREATEMIETMLSEIANHATVIVATPIPWDVHAVVQIESGRRVEVRA